jgi:homeobox protein ESX1
MSEPATQDTPPARPATDTGPKAGTPPPAAKLPPEIGGAPGPDPTRYGDWQHKGRVTDF